MFDQLPDGFNAVVLGGSGGIGSTLVSELNALPRCAKVIGLSRLTSPAIDYDHPKTLQNAANGIRDLLGEVHLLIIATGALASSDGTSPEKSVRHLTEAGLNDIFRINAIGPALALSAFSNVFPRRTPFIVGALSARVGSIGDNKLGGWISYRASKAALNQIVHTSAIEFSRTNPQSVCVALHPGTIETNLSRSFANNRFTHSAEESAHNLLSVLSQLSPEQTGGFFDYSGKEIVW